MPSPAGPGTFVPPLQRSLPRKARGAGLCRAVDSSVVDAILCRRRLLIEAHWGTQAVSDGLTTPRAAPMPGGGEPPALSTTPPEHCTDAQPSPQLQPATPAVNDRGSTPSAARAGLAAMDAAQHLTDGGQVLQHATQSQPADAGGKLQLSLAPLAQQQRWPSLPPKEQWLARRKQQKQQAAKRHTRPVLADGPAGEQSPTPPSAAVPARHAAQLQPARDSSGSLCSLSTVAGAGVFEQPSAAGISTAAQFPAVYPAPASSLSAAVQRVTPAAMAAATAARSAAAQLAAAIAGPPAGIPADHAAALRGALPQQPHSHKQCLACHCIKAAPQFEFEGAPPSFLHSVCNDCKTQLRIAPPRQRPEAQWVFHSGPLRRSILFQCKCTSVFIAVPYLCMCKQAVGAESIRSAPCRMLGHIAQPYAAPQVGRYCLCRLANCTPVARL